MPTTAALAAEQLRATLQLSPSAFFQKDTLLRTCWLVKRAGKEEAKRMVYLHVDAPDFITRREVIMVWAERESWTERLS
jgi:hypothetical protein